MSFCICAVHQLEESFLWEYEAPNMEFYWNSTTNRRVFNSVRKSFR